jgi:hypothetical protein
LTEAVEMGETGSLAARPESQLVLVDATRALQEKRSAWEAKHDIGHASDLLATALVFDRLGEVEDVAEFIESQGVRSPMGLRAAVGRLGIERGQSVTASERVATQETIRNIIHVLRGSLAQYPTNPLMWVELSRAQVLAGNARGARRAMGIALSLGSHNRFVVRSAARMHIHMGDPEQAHAILLRAPGTLRDPWLLAAEIAVASAAQKTSGLVGRGRSALKDRGHRPMVLAELGGAIGTLEAEAGRRKEARRLFADALLEPTENVVAQAKWVARATHALQVDDEVLTTPHSHEAKAWNSYYLREWDSAIEESKRWLSHEPYSSRAAILATYLSSTIFGRHGETIELARAAELASPGDALLLNNFAFALASSDQASEARKVLGRIRRASLDGKTAITLTATEGLIQFRSGNIQAGRELYRAAIEQATKLGHDAQAVLATVYLAREELRAGTTAAAQAVEAASTRAQSSKMEEAKLVLARVQSSAATRSSLSKP